MYINHYTLNTNHTKQFKKETTNDNAYFRTKTIIKKAGKEKYTQVLDNVFLELTIENGRYVGTLYAKYNDDMIPFLITQGCNSKDLYADSCKILAETYEQIYNIKAKIMPLLPYVCDIVLPTLPPSEFAKYIWVAEFCERIGMELL